MNTIDIGVSFFAIMCFVVYVVSVNSLPSEIGSSCSNNATASASGENIGFCFKVSATVERDYYFGLVEMKTRVLGNDIDRLNRLAAPFTLLLAAAARTFIYRGRQLASAR
jgi:hypothetical protein